MFERTANAGADAQKSSKASPSEHHETSLLSLFADGAADGVKRPITGLQQLDAQTRGKDFALAKEPVFTSDSEKWAYRGGQMVGNIGAFIATTTAAKFIPGAGRAAPIFAGGVLGFCEPTAANQGLSTRIGHAAIGANSIALMEYLPGALNATKIAQGALGQTATTGFVTGMVDTQLRSKMDKGEWASPTETMMGGITWSAFGIAGHGAVKLGERAGLKSDGKLPSSIENVPEIKLNGTRTEAQLELHRQSFPALADQNYLNFGMRGTLPREALQDLALGYKRLSEADPNYGKWRDTRVTEARATLAKEVGATPENLAFTSNTTDGCNIVLWGMKWKKGDHLLLSDAEHPSVLATTKQIAERYGVEVTTAPLTNAAEKDVVDIIRAHMRPETKLVTLSHILWNTGQVLPVSKIAHALHARSTPVPLLIDGAQSGGMLPLSLEKSGVDFYAFTGHKWFSGPEGVGALYVKSDQLQKLSPSFSGWRALDESAKGIDYVATATKFEGSTAPFPAINALRRTVDVHNRYGDASQRYEQIVAKATRLREELASIPGVKVNDANAQKSGLVTFSIPQVPHAEAVSWLGERNIVLKQVPGYLRASVHYLTSNKEVSGLVSAVRELATKMPKA